LPLRDFSTGVDPSAIVIPGFDLEPELGEVPNELEESCILEILKRG